jgi:tetratricopeptide (TPR) repeat protein
MERKKNHSAILAKYYNLYKKNPRSRVFAPLAESYRKLGMLDEAFKILKDGIRNHPNYVLGYVVLANLYYDQERYDLTYSTLRPIINQNADNISLQKIFAQACIHLGHLDEALDTFKYLLFMNPKDKYFAQEVKKLEDDLLIGHKKLSLEQLIKTPDLEKTKVPLSTFDDDWVQVNFIQHQKNEEALSASLDNEESKILKLDDQWVMKKTGSELHPILKEEKIQEKSLEDEFFADEFEASGDIDEINSETISSDTPIISHTLIDLYCSQHYYDKAIELLEKITDLNSGDQLSIQKLEKIKQLKIQHSFQNIQESEQSGHDELISIIESQVKVTVPKELTLQKVLENFLLLLREKAVEHRKLL